MNVNYDMYGDIITDEDANLEWIHQLMSEEEYRQYTNRVTKHDNSEADEVDFDSIEEAYELYENLCELEEEFSVS